MDTKLLTAKNLGQLLALSKRQISRLNSCGKLPKPLKIGGSIRWDCRTVEEWVLLGCPDRAEFEARQKMGAAHA